MRATATIKRSMQARAENALCLSMRKYESVGILESLVMGVVQGLTEFLPVSSSGHLALLNLIFGNKSGNIDFTLLLHIGTLIATFVFFWRDIVDLLKSLLPRNKAMVGERRMLLALLVATLVTGPIGLVLEPKLNALSTSLLALGISYLMTTIILCGAEYFTGNKGTRTPENMGIVRAALVGLFQGLAVVPGISRSGSTIAGGMVAGLNREKSTRFSFLLAIPIILAGGLKDAVDLVQGQVVLPGALVCVVGFLAATVVGYLAIRFMVDVVKRIKLYWFAGYTALLGIVLLVLHVLNVG